MVDASVLIVDAIGLLIVIWLFQLVRRDRLYVGYGVIFVLVITAGLVLLTFPASGGRSTGPAGSPSARRRSWRSGSPSSR